MAGVQARLEIDCRPAVCELFAGGACERPSVDLLRRKRDGHLNCSTENLTAVPAHRKANFATRSTCSTKSRGCTVQETAPSCARTCCFGLDFEGTDLPTRSIVLEGHSAQRADSKKLKNKSSWTGTNSGSRPFEDSEARKTPLFLDFSYFKSFRRVRAPK